MREGFETNLAELRARCDARLAALEDDLELRRKVWLHASKSGVLKGTKHSCSETRIAARANIACLSYCYFIIIEDT